MIVVVALSASCGVRGSGATPQGSGLPASCDEAATHVLQTMRHEDPELAKVDADAEWAGLLGGLVRRRCELDHWSAQARDCTTIDCWARELSRWQQGNVRAVVMFALTRGFQVKTKLTLRDLTQSTTRIARLATCEHPGCAFPDTACDAAVAAMIKQMVKQPSEPGDVALIQANAAFRPSLHVMLYDQCASGIAMSGHELGAWSPGARACFAARGIAKECTDQLTEPQRDAGEFVIAPWFDALRGNN